MTGENRDLAGPKHTPWEWVRTILLVLLVVFVALTLVTYLASQTLVNES